MTGPIAMLAGAALLHGCGQTPAPVAEAHQIDAAIGEAERRGNAARASTASPSARTPPPDPAA